MTLGLGLALGAAALRSGTTRRGRVAGACAQTGHASRVRIKSEQKRCNASREVEDFMWCLQRGGGRVVLPMPGFIKVRDEAELPSIFHQPPVDLCVRLQRAIGVFRADRFAADI